MEKSKSRKKKALEVTVDLNKNMYIFVCQICESIF